MHKLLRINHVSGALSHVGPLGQLINFEKNNFSECLSQFFSLRLVYGNSISRSLSSLGLATQEVVFDCYDLQKKWVDEFCPFFEIKQKSWMIDILIQQISFYSPDILFFQNDLRPFPFPSWSNLKSNFASVKKIIVHRGVDGKYDLLRGVDLLLLGSPKMVEDFRSHGATAELMYHYFDEEILLSGGTKKYSFTFVGSSGCGSKQHTKRYWMLLEMLLKTNILLFISELLPEIRGCEASISASIDAISLLHNRLISPNSSRHQIFKTLLLNQFNALLQSQDTETKHSSLTSNVRLPAYRLTDSFPGKCRPPVFGNQYYQVLADSRVSFDIHSDFAKGYSVALRLFHATGCGSCLLVDQGRNLSDLFELDKEVVSYSSTDEAIDKAKYLIENPLVAQQIGDAGQRRTLKDHTSLVRAHELLNHLSNIF